MRTIFTLLLVLSSVMGFAQDSEMKKIDTLLKETGALETTKEMLGRIIRQQASKKPNTPKDIEQQIQASINYDGYLNDIKKTFAGTFSEKEIDELLTIYRSGDMELYKKKTAPVAQELYKIGTAFGREAVALINRKMDEY